MNDIEMIAADAVAPSPEAIDALVAGDPIFARCLAVGGPLTARLRLSGFDALLRIILDQQVSTAAGAAMWRRLTALLDPVTPRGLLALDDEALCACGFSRQKMAYGRGLAEAVVSGRLALDSIHGLDDEGAIAALTSLKGIGRWSAEIYLLLSLGRPDIWPVDDLAIAVGVQWLKDLPERPARPALVEIGEGWRPHRSTAARLIWHYYRATLVARRRVSAATGAGEPRPG